MDCYVVTEITVGHLRVAVTMTVKVLMSGQTRDYRANCRINMIPSGEMVNSAANTSNFTETVAHNVLR